MPETRLDKHHTDALWSIALSEHNVDPRIIMTAPHLLGLDFHPQAAPPVLGVEDAVKQLLRPSDSGQPASHPALMWAFSALYNRTHRFADRQALRDRNELVRKLADAVGIALPPPGSGESAYQLLMSSTPAAGICAPVPVETTSCFFPDPPNRAAYTRVRAVVEVNRPLEDLVHAMDPRNWQKCIGGPFIQSYQIEADVMLGKTVTPIMQLPFLAPVKSQNMGTPVDHLIPLNGGAADGAPWDGLLYEEFEVASSGFKFRNVLVIRYEQSLSNLPAAGDSITLTYEQTRNVTEWMGGAFEDLMFVNCGQTVAKRDPADLNNRTIVEGYKDVSIGDMTPLTSNPASDVGKLLQLLAPGLLALWNQSANDFGMCC